MLSKNVFAPGPIELEVSLFGLIKAKTAVQVPPGSGSTLLTAGLGLTVIGAVLVLLWLFGILQQYLFPLAVAAVFTVALAALSGFVVRLAPRTGISWNVRDAARAIGRRGGTILGVLGLLIALATLIVAIAQYLKA